jgi:hypothetical protein
MVVHPGGIIVHANINVLLNLQPNQDIGRVHRERRFGNNSAPNIHEGMQQATERWRILFEGDYKRGTLKVLIGKIQERDDTGIQINERTSRSNKVAYLSRTLTTSAFLPST